MITGFNTDVEYNGRVYHIQTEDKGTSNPIIESLICVGGEVLASRRTPYGELLRSGLDERVLSGQVVAQHHRMIMDVRQGKYDPEGVKPFGAGIISDRGFEEVVLGYLSTELSSENLQISLDSQAEFVEGKPADLAVTTRGEISALRVGGVNVAVWLITTADKPRALAEGKTDAKGHLRLRLDIPEVEEGRGALLLRATHGEEMVELKWLVTK